MFIEQKITERIKKVKEIYSAFSVQTEDRPFYYSGDRWISLGFLEGWLKNYRTPSTKLRRSLAEAHELDCAMPVVDEHELIVGKVYFPKYDSAEQERFNTLLESFKMSCSSKEMEGVRARADHIALDYEKLLRVGVSGVLEEIKQKKKELDFSISDNLYDFSVIEKNEFYDCCIIELEAVLRLAKRYSNYALELSKTTDEPRKSELIRISKILENVPKNPARNFYEAVQSVHFFTFNMFGLYPLGRPDRYLLSYYENDIKNGIIDKSFAQELIDNLCLGVSTYTFTRAACGFIVGGTDECGNLVENDLTYMFLTALRHIKMPDPNGALAVNEQTGKQILEYATDIIGEGTTHPAIYNDAEIIKGLISYGVDSKDAVNYIHTTCAEISVVGKSRMYTTSINVNMPLELVNLVGEDIAVNDFSELESAYFERIKNLIADGNKRYALRILEAKRNGLQPVRASCFIDDCIKAGKDVYSGGAKYSYMQPIFIGFANLCDSLIAIKDLVFTKKRLSLKEFYEIVKNDYKDNEELRQYILKDVCHYGNDHKETDDYAHYLLKNIQEIFKDNSVFGSKFCMPGTFSYVTHAFYGYYTGATFDGRKAQKSLADGCCPVQGMDKNGATAMINSLTGWDQKAFMGGMVINLKFNKSAFNEDKKGNLISIIKAFIKRGGIEMQINCVDRKTLEKARISPSEYSNLMVRVGGFSDYFVRLSETTQKEIIERTEY